MIKKIVLAIVILTIIFLAINYKFIYNFYMMNQYTTECTNLLNGNFNSKTNPRLIKEYQLLQMPLEDLNHYDITELIETYIDMLKKSCELYKKEKAGEDAIFTDPPKFKNYMESEMGKDIIMRNDAWLQTFFDITDDDIVNYDNGTFTDLLINELKKYLEYEEIDGKIKWEINSIEEKTIELPYNCYLEYIPYKKIKHEGVKECKQVIKTELKNPKEFDSSKTRFPCIITYEAKDGSIEKINVTFMKDIIDSKEYFAIGFPELWDTPVTAYATLKSHTGDRRNDEAIAEAQRLHDEEEERFNSENYEWVDPYVVGEQQIKLREAIFGK